MIKYLVQATLNDELKEQALHPTKASAQSHINKLLDCFGTTKFCFTVLSVSIVPHSNPED